MYYTRGDSQLEPLQTALVKLQRLLTEDSLWACIFCKEICKYNLVLAFMSVSYNKDIQVSLYSGIQCFQIHSKLFHLQGPLQPEDSYTPAFAQLFFYDPEYTTDIQLDCYPTLDYTVLLELLQMLTDYNPFIYIYKTAYKYLVDLISSQF